MDEQTDNAELDLDTITISSTDTSGYLYSTVDMSSYNYTYNTLPGSVTIGATGSNGSFLTSSGFNGTNWTVTSGSPGLHVKDTATFEGDVIVKGRNLEKMFQKIEDRLAILQDPDPAKLEKYAALKKAYEHYKTLERLIGED